MKKPRLIATAAAMTLLAASPAYAGFDSFRFGFWDGLLFMFLMVHLAAWPIILPLCFVGAVAWTLFRFRGKGKPQDKREWWSRFARSLPSFIGIYASAWLAVFTVGAIISMFE